MSCCMHVTSAAHDICLEESAVILKVQKLYFCRDVTARLIFNYPKPKAQVSY